MEFPEPEVGLVISYSYLWNDEAADGHVEGRKARPCVAEHLGLDSDTAWVVLKDVNVFGWPGYDLRQVPEQAGRYDYGLLPPRFFQMIVQRFTELRHAGRIVETSRDDDT